MSSDFYENLDEQYEVPNECVLQKIRDGDQNILNNLFKQINDEKIDQISSTTEIKYASMFRIAHTEIKEAPKRKIQFFLTHKLKLDNFEKISLFAKTNKLKNLKSVCLNFYKNSCEAS